VFFKGRQAMTVNEAQRSALPRDDNYRTGFCSKEALQLPDWRFFVELLWGSLHDGTYEAD
jgi:hypothetical protein